MSTEDGRFREEVPAREDATSEGQFSFDELARGLADGAIPRRRALKLAGAAILGAGLSIFMLQPDAEARRRHKHRRRGGRRICPKNQTSNCCRNDRPCRRGECQCPANFVCVRDQAGNMGCLREAAVQAQQS
jgi:hypothetical protein